MLISVIHIYAMSRVLAWWYFRISFKILIEEKKLIFEIWRKYYVYNPFPVFSVCPKPQPVNEAIFPSPWKRDDNGLVKDTNGSESISELLFLKRNSFFQRKITKKIIIFKSFLGRQAFSCANGFVAVSCKLFNLNFDFGQSRCTDWRGEG